MDARATRAWSVVRRALHDHHDRTWLVVQLGIGVLVAASISLLVAELVWESELRSAPAFRVVDDAILWIFVAELALRVSTFQPPHVRFFALSPVERIRHEITGRVRYLLEPLNLADLLAVLAVVPALRGLRALRLLRLLRGVRVFRYANPLGGFSRALHENRLPFMFALAFLLSSVLLFGTMFYMVEVRVNPEVSTLADGYWWSIVTISTVGFGDIAPVSVMGRAIAAVLMVVGMFTLALFAGVVGHSMLAVLLTVRQEQFRMGGYVNHLVVCGYDPAARRLLDELSAEVGRQFEGAMVVFCEGERPSDLAAEFAWVAGDSTKESELDKVRLDHAAVAIIVGSRSTSPQQADAATILTAFTIRRRLRTAQASMTRARPLYIIAEILDAENVEHARTAGCNEVIETNRLGFALLAHATAMHGTASILSEVASRGSQSLYVGTNDRTDDGETFEQLAAGLKRRHGLLLIGFRPRGGTNIVNPAADAKVPSDAQLLYFAERPILPHEEPR